MTPTGAKRVPRLAPENLGLEEGPPSNPISQVRWTHIVPAQQSAGPGCLIAVELTAGPNKGLGYSHVWHPETAAVAAALGVAASRELPGTAASSWPTTRLEIVRGPFKFLGAAGLSGAVLSAVDMAMWDLRCTERDVSIESLLGHSGPVALYSGTGLQPPATAAECGRAAEILVNQGFNAVKVWVTRDDEAIERDRLRSVRAAIGSEAHLFVDAAAAYTTDSARWMLELAAEFEVEWVEDPIERTDVRGMAQLAEVSPVPLAGGQEASVAGLDELLSSVQLRTVLLDLQQVGGITGWMDAVRVCGRYDVQVTSHAYTHMGVRLLAGGRLEQAMVQHAPWDDNVFGSIEVKDGYAHVEPQVGAAPRPQCGLNWVGSEDLLSA